MTHEPPALPRIAQDRPRVRYARKEGRPPQGEGGGGLQAPHSSEQGCAGEERVFMEVWGGWSPNPALLTTSQDLRASQGSHGLDGGLPQGNPGLFAARGACWDV